QWYIPNNCQSKKRFNVGIMRQRFQRIPKKDKHVNISFSDQGAYLQVTTQWTALQSFNINSYFSLKYFTCCACGKYIELQHAAPIKFHPFDQLHLLVVVSNERNTFPHHRNFLLSF